MSSSLSVLLMPLQELQMEEHYTSTVVGCVLSGLPNTGGSGSVLHCNDVQTDSTAFLEPVKAFLPNNSLQCQRAAHNTCNAYSVHGEVNKWTATLW